MNNKNTMEHSLEETNKIDIAGKHAVDFDKQFDEDVRERAQELYCELMKKEVGSPEFMAIYQKLRALSIPV